MSYINSVCMLNPANDKLLEINLAKSNLILVGNNGCGKTRVLKKIYESTILRLTNSDYSSVEKANKNIQSLSESLVSYPQERQNFQSTLDYWLAIKKEFDNITINFDDMDKLNLEYNKGNLIVQFFGASRQAGITSSGVVQSLESIKGHTLNATPSPYSNTSGSKLEDYLVSLRVYQSTIEKFEKNDKGFIKKSNNIDKWFIKLEDDLRNLLEDSSLTLKFIYDKLKFEIHQKDKKPYNLQSLSSGISAILDIYAELLIGAEARELSPDKFKGIILIDEIDVHLHLSIQKKIFSFLSSAFPMIQFIVTTHSPFVVMSVTDSKIFDIGHNQSVDDVSMYSYTSVAEGLFGINPVSEVLTKKLTEMIYLSNKKSNGPIINKLKKIITEVEKYTSHLDSKSIYYLNEAKMKVIKDEEE